MRNFSLFITVLFVVAACSPEKKRKERQENVLEQHWVPGDWVAKRVEDAKERMNKDEATKVIWQSIEAHGGLEKWFANGPISFRFNYRPLEKGIQRDTYQTIDTWSSRAVHNLSHDKGVKFGWDGQQAWKHPSDASLKINARFWSLAPYYFVGVPFVLADKGLKYELLEDEIIESAIHHKVKVSFENGIGDAPDDYYIVYIDQETKFVDALIYIVSYPKFFPNGGHSEEKFMDYIGAQTVDGITLPKEYKTYLREGENGFVRHVTDVALTELSFNKGLAKDYFKIPDGAVIVE